MRYVPRTGDCPRFLHLCIAIITTFILAGCISHSLGRPMYSISFESKNETRIFVNSVFFDGKEYGIPVGILAPHAGSSASMFPINFPEQVRIEYELEDKDLSYTIDVSELRNFYLQNKYKEMDFYFVYTRSGEFVSKLYIESDGDHRKIEGYMYPDENQTEYKEYKQVVAAVVDGNIEELKRLAIMDAPFYWENEPVTLSTIERASQYGNVKAFEIIEQSNADFPSFCYSNSIKLAAQNNHIPVLEKLLNEAYTQNITTHDLQRILSSTVSLNTKSSPEALGLLLNYFKLLPDFRLSDYGHNLLSVATMSGKEDMVKYLLSIGADKELAIGNGKKAIDYARDESIRNLLNNE